MTDSPLVLVTGASQGIGAAVAQAFAALPGARLVLVSRSHDKLEATAEACRAAGAQADVFACDLTDDAATAETLERIAGELGVPDIVVNNAGLFVPAALAETDVATFRSQIDVNLTSAFVVTRALLPAMTQRGSGHLFFMASVASIRAYAGGAAYCAAKHGLLGLARVVREETRASGLRVTTLLPGATLTPSWEGTDLPPERFMPPDDIAAALLDAYRMSGRTVVEEIVLRPQLGDI
jgi:NAD(P)-dependent dehydrogenase (short-subunit alcohol dehydrogenase family)